MEEPRYIWKEYMNKELMETYMIATSEELQWAEIKVVISALDIQSDTLQTNTIIHTQSMYFLSVNLPLTCFLLYKNKRRLTYERAVQRVCWALQLTVIERNKIYWIWKCKGNIIADLLMEEGSHMGVSGSTIHILKRKKKLMETFLLHFVSYLSIVQKTLRKQLYRVILGKDLENNNFIGW